MREVRRVALTLFLCLFANQAGILVLSPTLVDVAGDLGVSTALAGQLRTVMGVVAGITALGIGPLASRIGLRSVLLTGLVLLATASVMSAAAPSFAVLAAAQVPLGAAVAMLLSAAVAGTTAWIRPGRRTDALSAAFSGQAAAWLIGQPIVGAIGAVSWRLTWLALPFVASLAALALALRLPKVRTVSASGRGDLSALFRNRTVVGWWLGELCAFSAWVGMLVYSGALLIDSYGTSLPVVGLLLGVVFIAYIPGTLLFRRWVGHHAQLLLVALALGAAAMAALIGAARPGLWLTVPLLAAYVFFNSGRTLSGSSFGLDVAPDHAVAAMGIRASATQGGYLIGAGLGGLALFLGGYAALGATFATLYVLAVVPHVLMRLWPRPSAVG